MTAQTHEMLLGITLVLMLISIALTLRFAHLKTRFQNWLARQVPDDPANRLYGPSRESISNPRGVLERERVEWRDRKLTWFFATASILFLLATLVLWLTK